MVSPYMHGWDLDATATGPGGESVSYLNVTVWGMEKVHAQINLSKIISRQPNETSVEAFIISYIMDRDLGGGVHQRIIVDMIRDSAPASITVNNLSRVEFMLVVRATSPNSYVSAKAVASVANTEPGWGY
jgi:hypothetical protein